MRWALFAALLLFEVVFLKSNAAWARWGRARWWVRLLVSGLVVAYALGLFLAGQVRRGGSMDGVILFGVIFCLAWVGIFVARQTYRRD